METDWLEAKFLVKTLKLRERNCSCVLRGVNADLRVRQCPKSEMEICVSNDMMASKCKNSNMERLEDVNENYCY